MPPDVIPFRIQVLNNGGSETLKIQNLLITIISIAMLVSGSPWFSTVEAADKENCLMCHKYPSMARIGEDGLMRNYHVNEHIFLNSLHGEVECRGCHTYIKKFPHDPVTEEVNCANECHIKPPFAEKNFSHQKIIEVFNSTRLWPIYCGSSCIAYYI